MLRRALPYLLACSLFLTVVGLKFDVVHRFGSDLPMWDQWDAEGMTVFVPWAKGELTLEHIIRPHNEHRIALTRLLGMAELAVNGQWDARLQCVVNAALHACLALALFALSRRLLGPAWSLWSFVLLAALIGLPISWQNVISGFHSPQYFLLLTTVGAVALIPTSAPGSPRWWAGGAAGFLSPFSLASGLLAPVAAAGVTLLQSWRGERTLRAQWPTLVLCALLTVCGVALLVRFPGHDFLKARNFTEFFLYAIRSLQWPYESVWAAALLWAPLVWLGALLLRRQTPDERSAALVVLALGSWTFAQILASAYARGADAQPPASRYLDSLAFGLAINGLAAAWVVQRSAGYKKVAAWALLVVWTGVAGWGIDRLVRSNFAHDLPETRAYYARCEANVRAYLATNDPGQLRNDDFPYPNLNNFRERADQPALRAIMPASVRPPLRLQTARGEGVLQEVPAGRDPARPAAHWTSRGGQPGGWESVVLEFPRATTLQFRFSGSFGSDATPVLQFRDTRLGAPIADLWAERRGRGPEYTATVTLPAGNAQLVGRLEHPSAWLTFEGPVEVARLSDFAAGAAAAGRWIALVGFVAGLLLLAGERAWARR
jgi:hypothetical protein